MASHKDFDLVQGNQLKIGQNSFQFDHDRIRHVDKYKQKCINILFKQTTEERFERPEQSFLTKMFNKFIAKRRRVEAKCEAMDMSPNPDYLYLPSGNMELLSLVTQPLDANPSSKSSGKSPLIRRVLNKLSAKLVFYRVHTFIMDHLDKSNIYESIREELLSFHKNREIGVVERILFTDSIYNT